MRAEQAPRPDELVIAIVDDEPLIQATLVSYFENAGFQVRAADTADGLRRLMAREKIDFVLLDIRLPDGDGLSLMRDIRAESDVPVILVTGRTEEADRIIGLELGADDYVTKPFSPRELVARVKAVLRRRAPAPPPAITELRHNRLRLDLEGYRAFWDQTEVILTATEFALLRTLAERPGKVFSRDALMDGAYDDFRVVADRTLDSHVRRIRAKFQAAGGEPVETAHGLGYKLSDCR